MPDGVCNPVRNVSELFAGRGFLPDGVSLPDGVCNPVRNILHELNIFSVNIIIINNQLYSEQAKKNGRQMTYFRIK